MGYKLFIGYVRNLLRIFLKYAIRNNLFISSFLVFKTMILVMQVPWKFA